jgi:hypothetical protein
MKKTSLDTENIAGIITIKINQKVPIKELNTFTNFINRQILNKITEKLKQEEEKKERRGHQEHSITTHK